MRRELTILIAFFVLSTILLGNPQSDPDSSQSALFRLFKPKKVRKVEYEKGYYLDQIFRRREFHEPVTFIPVEMRYGFGYNGGKGFMWLKVPADWMKYDNSSVDPFDGGSFTARLGHQLDLDLVKTNLAYYLLGTSWLDMHTGINLRYASLFLPPEIPSSWSNVNSTYTTGVKFSGKLLEISWSQSLMLQWFESWYLNFRYTYGWASSRFYSGLSAPSGTGPSQSFALGGRIILDTGQTSRYTVGLDLKYTHTVINHIKDPDDLTPISGFTLNNLGVYATASVFFGGRKTSGDVGKEYYYRKDYIAAKRELESFVNTYPRHANRRRAEKLLLKSTKKIPYQLVREGVSFDERGLTDKALGRYLQARSLADSTLKPVLEERLKEMAYHRLEVAEELLNQDKGDSAVAMVKQILDWYPEVAPHVLRIETDYLMQAGKKALDHGFYSQALNLFNQAVAKDSSRIFEVEAYRYQIAADLLATADSLRDANSIRFIVYALEEARRLTGGLGKENEELLLALKEKLAQQEKVLMRQRIQTKMDQERRRLKEKPQPVEVGMTIAQVQEIMGEPSEKTFQGKDQKNQLWIYHYQNGTSVLLTFSDYILYRIEVE